MIIKIKITPQQAKKYNEINVEIPDRRDKSKIIMYFRNIKSGIISDLSEIELDEYEVQWVKRKKK